MKNKIVVISAVVLVVSLGYFFYNQVVAKAFRYATPMESFSKSGQRGSELVDILEEKDVALIIYKKKNGAYSSHIVAKDSRGWTPLSVNYRNRQEIMQKDVIINVKEVQKKIVVQIVDIAGADEDIPIISDSVKSTFLSRSYEFDGGVKLFYAFLVLEELPDDYRIKLGDQEIAVR